MTSLIQNIYRESCEGAKTGLLFGVSGSAALAACSVTLHLVEIANRAIGNPPSMPLSLGECKRPPFRDLKGGCENYLFFDISISFVGPLLATTTICGAVAGAVKGFFQKPHRD